MADKDPFAEFVVAEEPAAPAEASADPFAAFAVPEDVKQAGSELAQGVKEEAPGWADSALAFTQGLTRYAGGDFLREGGRRLVQAGAEALGADPQIAKEYNPFQTREEVLANKAVSPTAATAGEVTGLIASAVAPATKLLPSGAINAAGAATNAAVLTKLAPAGSGVLKSVVAKAPALFAQGAVEGAATAAFDEVNNAFLNKNYSKLAERIPASVGTGAAYGGATSLAVGGALKVGGMTIKAASKLLGAGQGATDILEQAAREQSKAVVNSAARELDNATAMQRAIENAEIPVRTAEEFAAAADERLAQLSQNVARQEFTLTEKAASAIEYDDVLKAANNEFRDAGNELQSIREVFDVEGNRDAKQRLIAGLVDDVPATGAQGPQRAFNPLRDEHVVGLIDNLGAKAEEMLSGSGAIIHAEGGGSQALKRIVALSKAYKAEVAGELNAGKSGNAFNYLDDLRQAIGRLQKSRDPSVRRFAEDSYESFRVMQEDPRLWGKAADAQRIFNAGWSREITAESADGIAGMFADSGKKHALDPWRNSEVINDAATRAMLSELGTGLETRKQAVINWLGAVDSSLTARAQALGNPALIEKANRARELVQKMRDSMVRVEETRIASDQMKALRASGMAEIPVVGKLGMSGVEAMGKAHIAQREAAKAQRKVIAAQAARNMVDATARVNEAAAKGRLWTGTAELAGGVSATLGSLKEGAKRIAAGIDNQADKARFAATVMSAVDLAEKQSTPDTVEADNLANTHTALQIGLGEEQANAYLDQVSKRNAFILEKAGPRPTPTPLNPKPKRVMDEESQMRMKRYLDAADKPEDAIKRISDGEGTAEDLETLSTLYPGMLDDFRTKAVAHIVESGKELSYDQQLRVAEALMMPLNRDMDPDSIAFWQQLGMGGAQAKAQEQREQIEKSGKNPAKYKSQAKGYASKSERSSAV